MKRECPKEYLKKKPEFATFNNTGLLFKTLETSIHDVNLVEKGRQVILLLDSPNIAKWANQYASEERLREYTRQYEMLKAEFVKVYDHER